MPDEVTPPEKKRQRALSPENFEKQLQRKVSLLIDDAIEQAKKGKPALLRILLQLIADERPQEEEQPQIEFNLIRPKRED
ncbi:MAG TPA: hypothetical protein VOA78_07805 [Candidatus Dormibacteraeota bacterium]|nr:hypothetical protein [Candidatus Dormibacteraeota bacterium]